MCEVRSVKSEVLIPFIVSLLENGKRARMSVTGMSMYPFLRSGVDTVELSPVNFDDIRVGDMVLGRRTSGEYIMHRVFKKDDDNFYMIGDAQTELDGPYSRQQLIAGVYRVWRKDKLIDCSNKFWKFLVVVWMYLRPFRPLIINSYRKLRSKGH